MKGKSRRMAVALAAVLLATGVQAQELDFMALKDRARAVYPDENLLVFDAVQTYEFEKSTEGGDASPLKARLKAELYLINILNRNTVRIYESTNSFSEIEKVKAWRYNDESEFAYLRAKSFTFHYESGGIFHHDFYVNDLVTQATDAGIYRLAYTKTYDDYKFLAAVDFTGHLPTLSQVIHIDIPAWLDMEISERNFEGFGIEKTVAKTDDGGTRYTYTWTDMPALKKAEYAPSSRHYLPHLILVYRHLDDGGEKTTLMPDASGLYGWYSSLVNAVEENPADLAEPLAHFRTLPAEEHIEAVYNWVRDNIRYIAFEAGLAGFQPESCQGVYSNRYGDCKGMANLCKNLLVELGYDARLAWIGTRGEVPYDYGTPSLVVDNHMIAVVIDGPDTLYLDPTETYGRYDEYAYRIQGRPVMIENGDTHILSRVPKSDRDSDKVSRTYRVSFDPQKSTATYAATTLYRGEPKKQIHAGLNSILSQDRDKALAHYLRPNATGTFAITETRSLDTLGEDIEIAYEFTTREGVISLGGEYFVDIDPSTDLENTALHADRMAPWYFDERLNRHTRVTFTVPEGYRVQHVPESFQCASPDFRVAVEVTRGGNEVNIDKTIQVYDGEVSPKNRGAWEACVAKLNAYYQDRVIIQNEKNQD